MQKYRKEGMILKGYVRKSRDLDFEATYGFDPALDYEAERQAYNLMAETKDAEGCRSFMKRHGGTIAYSVKYAYYVELKKSKLL
jgi:hypothetical protein